MIVITVEMPDGGTLSISAETPEMFFGIRDFPLEEKIKSVLVEMTRAMCSLLNVSSDLSDASLLPLMVKMTATRSVTEEAEDELRFQAALDRAPTGTEGARATARLGKMLGEGVSLAAAWDCLSTAEKSAAEIYFRALKTDHETG